MLVAPHNVGGPVLTAASLQVGFACTRTSRSWSTSTTSRTRRSRRSSRGAPEVVDGYFDLSDKPGLGVELDVDAAAEFPQQQARFDLWAEGWEQRKPKGSQ